MLRAVLFDFDGVLMPHGSFWTSIDEIYPGMWEKLDKEFWGANDTKQLIIDWKIGKKNAWDIVEYIAHKFHLDATIIYNELVISAKEIVIDGQLLNYAQQLRQQGIKTAILTDHVDIFVDVIVPSNHLNNLFDAIFCSSVYGILKTTNDGAFISTAVQHLQIPMESVLVIDDWDLVCSLARKQGGEAYWYKGQQAHPQALRTYMQKHYPDIILQDAFSSPK